MKQNNKEKQIIKSEFCQNGFDHSAVANFGLTRFTANRYFDHSENFKKLIGIINKRAFKLCYSYLHAYNDTLLEDVSQQDVEKLIIDLQSKASAWHSNIDSFGDAVNYINSFYNISKKLVFYPQNSNLQNISFRRSTFMTELVCTPVANTVKGSPLHFSECSWENPFICAALIRVACNYTKFQKDFLPTNNNCLSGIRSSLFCRLAENEFSRTAFFNGETHRIFLNRQTSKIFAAPYSQLSSVEDVKPIRLFEKIKSYIEYEIEIAQNKPIECSICIIGHTEFSGVRNTHHAPFHRELYDLIYSIGEWYDSDSNRPTLHLTVTNCINTNDVLSKRAGNDMSNVKELNYYLPKDKDSNGEKKSTSIDCIIEKIDYTKKFAFSSQQIIDIINRNNVVFILDCPWLYLENYEIKQDSTLESYCKEINNDNLTCLQNDNCETSDNKHCRIDQPSGYTRHHKQIEYLNAQFNRIMASGTSNTGDVCRVFNDTLIKKIEETVQKKSNSNSIVYIFSSEAVGLQYSYTATHPLTRIESYEGKTFTILQFCNFSIPRLSFGSNSINFKISWWSTMKYISIMFAYEKFKNQVLRCIDAKFTMQNPLDYFTLCRNICTKVTVTSDCSRYIVNVQLCYNSNTIRIINKWIQESNCGKTFNNVLNNIGNLIIPIVKALYTQVLFNKNYHTTDGSINNAFGDEHIRTAFCMNLYSGISNIKEMIFWHLYRNACSKGNFENFDVQIKSKFEELGSEDAQKPNKGHYFMDKRLYDLLLQQLDYRNTINIALQSMINNVQNSNYYESPKSSLLYDLLCNIIRATGDLPSFDQNSTEIYSNAHNALDHLNALE